jgi:leader peptidase (prepilin peptidase)/N-methyltransferase
MPPWFLPLNLTLLGAVWGSFIAALCSRWPNGERIGAGRSRCDHCATNIAAYDLIPIVSFILLKGKCRACGRKIGALPLIFEVTAILVGTFPILFLPPIQAIGAAVFGWLLLPLLFLDWRHFWLPDRLLILLAIAGPLAGLLLNPSVTWFDRGVGMAAGFVSLEAIRVGFKRWRGYEGMGAGDPKLFGALGIWVGWQALPMILLGASAIGLGLILVTRTTRTQSPNLLPFGSYLCGAAYLFSTVA